MIDLNKIFGNGGLRSKIDLIQLIEKLFEHAIFCQFRIHSKAENKTNCYPLIVRIKNLYSNKSICVKTS